MEFVDRILKCSDCGNDFVFTAGEQLFFLDRQFKNDPKRCKLCKAKRAGLGRTVEGVAAAAALPLSRTETRTQCSECGVETTVPFKPTQGRPVFCRSCFQMKRVPAAVGLVAGLDDAVLSAEQAAPERNLGGLSGNQGGMSSGISLSASTMESIANTPAAALAASDSGRATRDLLASEAG